MSLLLNAAQRINRPKGNLAGISAGNVYSVAIDKNGNIWGWGSNSQVRLGDNTAIFKYTPCRIGMNGLNKTFCKITIGRGAAGTANSLTAALDYYGQAWGWGAASRTGDGTTVGKCYPVAVAGPARTFCKIEAGGGHALIIDKNGRAWAWGNNSNGQIGDNSTTTRISPVSVLGAVKTFCEISAGLLHSVAIDKNGRVWAWGDNGFAQIGDNSITQRNTPVSILGAVKTFCQISGGGYHSLAIDKNGRAWAWGFNTTGVLGDNSVASRQTPVCVCGAIKTFCKISAGNNHSLAIDKNGRAWAWGTNTTGVLGDNTTTSRLTPVSVLGAVKTFCQISAGATHSLAIDKNGKTWAWGATSTGQTGIGSPGIYSPVSVLGAIKTFCQVSCANWSIAIDKNGRAWGWGVNDSGYVGDNTTVSKLTPVSVLGAVKTFCQIATGNGNSLAIDKNGRAWAWGFNSTGQIGDNSVTSKLTPVSVLGAVKTFCKISGGGASSYAIDKNGRLWAWGSNSIGELGDNTTVSKLTPVSVLGAVKTFCQIYGGTSHCLALDKNGRAWAWGSGASGGLGDNTTVSKLTPVSVLGAVKTFCQIAAGNGFSYAIDKNGRAWAWGSNTGGQLGTGSVISVYTPISITGVLKTFCKISTGDGYSLAIDKNGRAWAWGFNTNGQLGDNSVTSRASPVSVLGAVKTFCKITGGGANGTPAAFSLAIDKNGRLWSWGANTTGQLGINSTVTQRTPVSVLGAVKTFCEISNGPNQGFALAIDKNGRLWSWGVNGNGQLGDNTSTSRLTPVSVLGAVKTFCKVSAGGFHSLAIDKNGRLWAWGNNSNGQLGNNTSGTTSVATPISVLGAVKTFCHIAGGNSQTIAIDKNGQAWGWGFNGSGQTGDGSATDRLTPVSVIGQKKTFCKIGSGNGVSLAIDNYGRLWGWGFNGNSQVGNNTSAAMRTPTRVCTNRTFCEITAGNTHVTAVEKNGQVWVWGANATGQLGNPINTSVLTPVSVIGAVKTFCKIYAGTARGLALDKYGKAWAWGLGTNGYGSLGTGRKINWDPFLSNWSSGNVFTNSPVEVYGNRTFCTISQRNDTVLAVDYTGRVWAWGLNNTGAVGNNYNAASVLTPVRVCVI